MAYRLIAPKNTKEPQGKFKLIPPTKQDKDERTYLQKTQDTLKPFAKYAAIGGKELASAVGGTIGNIQSLADSAADYIGDKLNLPNKDYKPPRSFPNSQDIRGFFEEKVPFTTPETENQQLFGEGTELLSNLVNPSFGGGVGPIKAAAGALAGLGGKEIAKQFGASEEKQDITKSLISLLPLILQGKYVPKTKEMKALYDYGKKLGMAEEELVPLLQSERKQNLLGKVASKSSKTQKTLESAGEKLSEGFSQIRKQSEALPTFTQENSKVIKESFSDVLKELKASRLPSPEKQHAIRQLDKLLRGDALRGEELLETYRDLNDVLGKARAGKRAIGEVKKAITSAFEEVDPQFAQDFKLSNALASKFYRAREVLAPNLLEKDLEFVKTLGEVGGVVKGVVTGDFNLLRTVLGVVGARKLAENLLTDPKWQSIHRNALRALKEQSPKAIASVGQQIKDEAEKEESS